MRRKKVPESCECGWWEKHLWRNGQPDWGSVYDVPAEQVTDFVQNWSGSLSFPKGFDIRDATNAFVAGHCSMDRSPLLVIEAGEET